MPSSDAIERVAVSIAGENQLVLARIPAGSFLMGSPESEEGLENERPQHKVTISKPFYMAEVPTTTAQYCAVIGENARELLDTNRELPAKEMTWFEAIEYCEILTATTGASAGRIHHVAVLSEISHQSSGWRSTGRRPITAHDSPTLPSRCRPGVNRARDALDAQGTVLNLSLHPGLTRELYPAVDGD